MAGRKSDAIWKHFTKIKVHGRTGWRAECFLCKTSMEGQVKRLKMHYIKCSATGKVKSDSCRRNTNWEKCRIRSEAQAKPTKWFLYDHLTFLEKCDYESRSLPNISLQNHSHDEYEERRNKPASREETSTWIDLEANNVEGKPITTEHEEKFEGRSVDNNVQTNICTEISSMKSIGQKGNIENPKDKFLQVLERRESEWNQNGCQNYRQHSSRNEDDTDVFFQSMAMTVKKFHPTLLAETKKRVLNVVMDLKLENEQNQPRNLSLPIHPPHNSTSICSSLPSPSNSTTERE